ncbi:Subunit of heteropentameric Replication factor C (RF-C), partial [Cichlidogyrus casuarinus]
IESGNFPHLLVYGPAGSGKKTRVHCILRLLYGNAIEKVRLNTNTFVTPSKKKVEVQTISSSVHMEVNAGDAGIYDRIVVQELIKGIASVGQLDRAKQRDFKVVVLYGVDQLTVDAQHALRRTMEKYVTTCRLILIAEQVSKITPATRSRCLPLRNPAPSIEQISDILMKVAKKESVPMSQKSSLKIAQQSGRNLRRALLMAEVAKVETMGEREETLIPDWQVYAKETAAMMVDEQSAKQVMQVRERLYNMIAHCIPEEVILGQLVDALFALSDQTLKLQLLPLAANFDHRMHLGSKPIFHLEAFVVHFMSLHKQHMECNL